MFSRLLLSAVVAGVLVGSAQADVIFQGFGDYATGTTSATGVAIPASISSGNLTTIGYITKTSSVANFVTNSSTITTYADWQTEVTNKFNADEGAYIPFDVLTNYQNINRLGTLVGITPNPAVIKVTGDNGSLSLSNNKTTESMTLLYGNTQTHAIRGVWSSTSDTGANPSIGTNTFGSSTATSGLLTTNPAILNNTYGTPIGNATNVAGMIDFSPFNATTKTLTFDQPFDGVDDSLSSPYTGTASGALINRMGFVVLNRSAGTSPTNTFSAKAYFSDGSDTTLNYTFTLANGTNNTAFLFEAPTGYSINSLDFNLNPDGGSYRIQAMDDLAFTTVVPEPGTIVLLACGSLALLRRRNQGAAKK